MSTRTITSLGSFRATNETPEERFKRLERKYGKDLHDALARKEQIRKDRKVKSWMEVYVLLKDQKNPKPLAPIQVSSPNGRVDARVAAGVLKAPTTQARTRTAGPPSPKNTNPLLQLKQNIAAISKEDLDACDNWLENEIQTEQTKLAELMKDDNTTESQRNDQRTKIEELNRQVEELRAFKVAAKDQDIRIPFDNGNTIYDKRVRQETFVALSVAFIAFLVMLIIMYFLN
jgi:hypothetical protein